MKISRFLVALVSLLSIICIAYEVDNYSLRYKSLPDSRDAMNDEVNRLLKESESKLEGKGCNPQKLITAVHDTLGNGVVGTLESFATDSDTVKKHQSPSENIYSKRSLKSKLSGFVMTFAGLNDSVNMNGQYVGADKFGHFIDQGWEYYKEYESRQSPSEGTAAALKHGMGLEDGGFGLRATGIKSHGDLAANYSGFRFWLNLHKGDVPYFKCQNDQWKQVRQFDFIDYVNPAWDEAINCSDFASNELAASVVERAKELEETAAKNGKTQRYVCPVSPNDCVKMKKYYGDKAPMILSEKCLNAQPEADNTRHSAQVSAQELGTSKYSKRTPKTVETPEPKTGTN